MRVASSSASSSGNGLDSTTGTVGLPGHHASLGIAAQRQVPEQTGDLECKVKLRSDEDYDTYHSPKQTH